jgi:ABC-type multidrug transport system ATPase subunit
MRARVGFSIATAVDPDILLLDEVLQTGDNKFKEKSRQRIAEVLQTAKAVVMVTHDMSWITAFCTRAILLDKGHIVAEGDPDEIADMHEQDAERRLKQKRKAKQLIKHGKVDLVDIRKARKAGTLGAVAEGQAQLADDELDEEDRAELDAVPPTVAARRAARGRAVEEAEPDGAVEDDAHLREESRRELAELKARVASQAAVGGSTTTADEQRGDTPTAG